MTGNASPFPEITWEVASSGASEELAGPPEVARSGLDWMPAEVPGTVAGALRAAGRWSPADEVDLDADDWWFRGRFAANEGDEGVIRFDGLATLAEVWVNGVPVLSSENMFVTHDVVVGPLRADNEILIACRSLTRALARRRPRPRWTTALVEQQNLRWARTTMLGRMPTWPPRAAPVGPWRPVTVTLNPDVRVVERDVQVCRDGDAGIVRLSMRVDRPDVVSTAVLHVGDAESELVVATGDGGCSISGECRLEHAAPWMPATHGRPALHAASVVLTLADARELTLQLGPVGFRTVAVGTEGGAFSISVEGVDVFCRGACWVPLDPVALGSTRPALRAALAAYAGAGLNMLRLTGTMVPEQDDFYDLCDELGIMVWHDLMFANFDAPIDDEQYAATVGVEVDQLLARLQGHPSVVVVCGGSEVEQQAAMRGVPRDDWTGRLAAEIVPAALRRRLPDVAYVPSSPTGGALPFRVSSGISHYYGVGAYLRPLSDARTAGVRFTTECLAFANVPYDATARLLLEAGGAPGHSPRWKAAVPRDRGVGWDFEDVRDHYVSELFGVDPMLVRYSDPARYLDLGRATTAHVIERTIAEWRRPSSTCDGALVFTARDLTTGAGWGLVDALGRPKSAFFGLARSCRPVAVRLSDEGLNGLWAHVYNDRPGELAATLRVTLHGVHGDAAIATVDVAVTVPPHSARELHVDAMFDTFRDLTDAYRFGPRMIDLVTIELEVDGACASSDHSFAGGMARPLVPEIGLAATCRPRDEDGTDAVVVSVTTRSAAQFVAIDVEGWVPEDNWFHLAPGAGRDVVCRRADEGARFVGELRALNSRATVMLRLA